MILKSSILLWPGAHFKVGPWSRFITRCWDLSLYVHIFAFWGPKVNFEIQNWTFEGCFETKMILKNILKVSALIPTQFPCKIMLFSMKKWKLPHFYPLWGAYWFAWLFRLVPAPCSCNGMRKRGSVPGPARIESTRSHIKPSLVRLTNRSPKGLCDRLSFFFRSAQ